MPEKKATEQLTPPIPEKKGENAEQKIPVDLQDQESDLNALQTQAETDQAKAESKQANQALAEEIEKKKYESLSLKTYEEVVKGTPLEQKLNKILSHPDFNNAKDYPELQGKTPEQRVEHIFQKINSSIARFYARKFDLESNQGVPPRLEQTIVPATEIFLMEMLKENKQENNINFLAQLGNIKIDGLVSAFQNVKSFAEKFTLPYQKGKSLMKILDFLALPQNRSELKNLNNPYEFYQKVMKNKVWENDQVKIENIKLSQFGLSFSNDANQQNSEAGLETIKAEIGSIQVVDSPETVKKLLTLVGKSDEILKKTGALSDQLLDSMDGVKSLDQTLQNTFGFNLFKEIKESTFLKGVADFFLNLLGFSGGLEGLERRWRKRNIDREIDAPKKKFISQTFEAYLQKKGNADLESTKKIFASYKIQVQEQDRGKFALDYPLLEEQIVENLDHIGKINPQLLASLSGEGFSGRDFVKEETNTKGEKNLKVKPDFLASESNKKAFCKCYFPKMLEALADNEDYLKTVKGPDDVAFLLTSGVSLETTNLIEGVSLGSIVPEDFYAAEQYPRNQGGSTETSDSIARIDASDITPTSPLVQKGKEIILDGESEGKFDAVNLNDKGKVSIGLIQWRDERAVNLLKRMKSANTSLFEQTMTHSSFVNLNAQTGNPWDTIQKKQFKSLMQNEVFQNVMDQQANEDLTDYVKTISNWGISDPKALLATMRIYNAGSGFAKGIIDKLSTEQRNNYQAIIAQYNTTKHGKKYQIFNKNNITEMISSYA